MSTTLLAFGPASLSLHRPDCEFVTARPQNFMPVPREVELCVRAEHLCRCLRSRRPDVSGT